VPKGMLIDLTKCMGCRSCQVACKQWNNLPAEKTSFNESFTNPPALSAYTFTNVEFHLLEESSGKLDWVFVKRQCLHCQDPACVSACPVEALYKTEKGAVAYDVDKCMGCRYCMVACPFEIPKFEWDKTYPAIAKCDLCSDRLEAGLAPACATACPTGAITFGEREELLKEARARMAKEPGKYINHIYGEKEVGGTGVLYLSSVPFEKLGFNTRVPQQALPPLTWNAISEIPLIALGVGALATGLYLNTKRRNPSDEGDTEKGEE